MLVVDLIPEELRKELQCGYCSNLLSIPNVTVPDDNGYLYACGRCSNNNGNSVRATAYEAIAQLIKFPCRYSTLGCNKQLSWGSVMDHEKACKNREYCCIQKNCNWKSNIENLKTHILENHNNIIIDKGCFKLPKRDAEIVNTIYAYDEIFLVEYKYVYKHMFSMNVRYIGKPSESGRFTCEVEMKRANSTQVNAIKVHNGKIKPYTDYVLDDSLEEVMDIKVDASVLEAIVKSFNINCSIQIIEKIPKRVKKTKEPNIDKNNMKEKNVKIERKKNISNKQQLPPKQVVSKQDVSNPDLDSRKDILKQLECPVCNEYISSHIFICSLGHNICEACKSKLKKCPICSAKYGNARNYAMEGMLQLIRFPCDNESYGCTFTGILTELKEHKKNCKCENIKCPVVSDCKWKGTIELLPMHLKNFHERSIYIDLNEIVTFDVKLGESNHNLVEFQKNIFRISCKRDKKIKGVIQWSFQKFCINDYDKEYKIEIEFIDQTNGDRKFIINDIFCDITDNEDIFDNSLSIPVALLEPFINSSKLLHIKYKIC